MEAQGKLTFIIILSSLKATTAYYRSCVTMIQDRLPVPSGENHALQGHVYHRMEVAGAYWCARRCLQQNKCQSFNYHVKSETCQLNDATAMQYPQDLVQAPDVLFWERMAVPTYFLGACDGHNCHPEAVCQPQDNANYTCECQNPSFGLNNCTTKVKDTSCGEMPCPEGATCVEVDNDIGYVCLCPPGLTGPRCDNIVCRAYNNQSASPPGWTPEVQVVWRNDAGTPVDMYWLPHDDANEQFAFTIPVAADKISQVNVEYVWVARDQDSKSLLMVDKQCSFVVPGSQRVQPVITSN